ncbi:MAG: GntR family transcriptional regulator [Bacteroidetes bacterium]|nr:MAG: GntR family transcriptional regulator [Bacteroidota bacterium]
MADVGKMNKLTVVRKAEHGIYLSGERQSDILMPKAYVPDNCQVDDELDVFVYRDSEDRIIATTQTPLAMVGDFAFLKVVGTTPVGAFLDWGLQKDLLVPFKEQRYRMKTGQSYVVYVYLDKDTDRVAASSKLNKFLNLEPAEYKEGEEVDLMIFDKTDLGYKVIVDNMHAGILYENEVFQPVHIGQQLKGFVSKIRSDGKIDIALQKTGYEHIDPIAEIILNYLKEHNGEMNFTDKSPAEEIYTTFGISKKNFKKALGALYRDKIIVIGKETVKLN